MASEYTASDRQLRAVIFDFGGVLTTSPGALMAERAAEAGHKLGDVLHLMMGPLDVDTSHPWHRIERGEITFDEMSDAMGSLFAAAGLPQPVRPPSTEEMAAAVAPVDEMLELVRAVRTAGLRTAILTNNIREWNWRGIVNADALVDVIVDSCEVGLRKPDEAIYRLTMERLGIDDPADCVYLDDFAWNISPAQSIGMHAIHVSDHATAIAEVRSLLNM